MRGRAYRAGYGKADVEAWRSQVPVGAAGPSEYQSSGPPVQTSAAFAMGRRGRLRAAGDVLFTGEKNQKPPGLVTYSVARPPDEPANDRRLREMTHGQDPAFRYAPSAR